MAWGWASGGCRVIHMDMAVYLLEVLGTEVVGMLGLDLVDLLEELVGVRRACRAIARVGECTPAGWL